MSVLALSEILTIMDKKYSTTPAHLKIDWERFIAWFNATLKQYGSAIPPVKVITKGKRVQAQRIINELGSKDVLTDAVEHMAKSDFCNGRRRTKKNPDGWIASFPWMLSSDEIIANLANGMYDNPPAADLTPDEQRQLEAERYRQQQDARRAENLAIEERIRAEERQRRNAMSHGCVTYEQYLAMKKAPCGPPRGTIETGT
jgi:hypothetical protein